MCRMERRGVQIALLVLLLAGMAGVLLIGSPAQRGRPEDAVRQPFDIRAWRPYSVLRRIADASSLYYRVGTRLITSLAAAGVLGLVGIAALGGRRRDEPQDEAVRRADYWRRVATGCLVGYVAFSAASAMWAHSWRDALGRTALEATWVLLAVGVGWALRPRWLGSLARGIVVVSVVVAILSTWYWIERQGATDRLGWGWPIANPLFVAAVLLPGLIFAVAGTARSLAAAVQAHSGPAWRAAAAYGAAAIVLAVTIWMTDSRGPMLAAGVGLVALPLFVLRGRGRLVAGGAALALIVLAGVAVGATGLYRGAFRQRTMQERFHIWRYALDMWREQPAAGWGAGSYQLVADSLSGPDRLARPEVLGSAWADHAHNEYLEQLADLGVVGLLLTVAALGATWLGVLTRRDEGVADGWVVAAAGAALAALAAEESFNVALRLEPLPVVMGTVWGMALAAGRRAMAQGRGSSCRNGPAGASGQMDPWAVPLSVRNRPAGVLLLITGLAVAVLGVQDWRAARAYFRAGQSLAARPAETERLSAWAARWLLDPLARAWALHRRIEARMVVEQPSPASTKRSLAMANRLAELAPGLGQVGPMQYELARRRAVQQPGQSIALRRDGLEALIRHWRCNPADPARGEKVVAGILATVERFLRLPAAQRPAEMAGWVALARQLAPQDMRVAFLSARWAIDRGDDRRAAAALAEAVRRGLDRDTAVSFLRWVLERRASPPLRQLLESLARPTTTAAGDR